MSKIIHMQSTCLHMVNVIANKHTVDLTEMMNHHCIDQ
jgi:hypothetical protein